MTAETETVEPCVICAQATDPSARADCYQCGEFFHLKLNTTSEAPDCGDVWLDGEIMALQFACSNCLAQMRGETPPAADAEPEPTPEEPSRVHRAAPGSSARDLARRRRRR